MTSEPERDAAAPLPNRSPTLRGGRFVICAPIGAGAQGSTWDGVDKREGRPVAIKRFDVRGARSWKDVELAEREARVLASLSHPKLPGYVDHFEEDGALYLVMEKIEGTPLSTVRKRAPISEAEAHRLLEDAEDVLRYLHGRQPPVIHRDLKPANVLCRPDGSYAFVDFGAVRDRMRAEGGSTVVGTFGFMAPEQLQGRAGPGADIYALGATVISALSGQEPEDLPHRGLSIDVDAAVGSSVSPELRATLAAMLEPDPDRRATSIRQAIERGRSAGLDAGFASELRQRIEREVQDSIDRETKAAGFEGRRSRKAERRLRKLQEKTQRRLRRLEERNWTHRGASNALAWQRHRSEHPRAHVFAAMALTIAQIAVGVALRVFVPLLLTFLSIFFGPALREASGRVRRAGGRAVGAIGQARQFVLDVHSEAPAAVRVDANEDPAKRRVSEQPAAPLHENATDSWDSEEQSSRRGANRR